MGRFINSKENKFEGVVYVAPLNKTTNEFGDFVTSKNKLDDRIKNIKRPKKRKARMNHKIDNAIDSVLSMGALWQNANKQKLTNTQTQNNKRKSKRK